ncbi:MAG: hypothetical protein HY288_06025 [Planctomycetia bacterium]|nr:hypothetical protein [Planctomycetia bacterium]
MSTNHKPRPEEVEHLLRNAELRNELEPYFDESIRRVNVEELPTPVENEFLASMLAWERAPILPISQWFDPELKLPHPETLSNDEIHDLLWSTIHKLYERRIVLDFTDHLSDCELYCLIYRDILPCSEKKIESLTNYLHWDCADVGGDPTVWLRYYASEEDRQAWAEDFPDPLPVAESPPYPRQLPRRPL